MTKKGRNQSKTIGEDVSGPVTCPCSGFAQVMSHLGTLLINSGQRFYLDRSIPLLCWVPMPWLHTVDFCSHPDWFEDVSPILRKSALTRPSSSWSGGLAWTPIPDRVQAAAFPIEEEREDWGDFSA